MWETLFYTPNVVTPSPWKLGTCTLVLLLNGTFSLPWWKHFFKDFSNNLCWIFFSSQQLRVAHRTATGMSGRDKTIDEFLRSKRFTSTQRKSLLSRKKHKRTFEFGDEDCLRAALVKSVSDQALNLLRATEPYPIPSGTVNLHESTFAIW